MDIAGRLEQLEDIVREAKSMPLSSSVLINKDEVLELVQQMQDDLPDEIKQARWIVKDREDLLAKARAEGDKLIEHAREEQLRMARKEEVVERAREEAERLLTEADDQTSTMRSEAEDYVDAKLAQFEIALRKILEDSQAATKGLARTLDQVEAGRDRLRHPTTAAEQEFTPACGSTSAPRRRSSTRRRRSDDRRDRRPRPRRPPGHLARGGHPWRPGGLGGPSSPRCPTRSRASSCWSRSSRASSSPVTCGGPSGSAARAA